jgi:hypothetical protein
VGTGPLRLRGGVAGGWGLGGDRGQEQSFVLFAMFGGRLHRLGTCESCAWLPLALAAWQHPHRAAGCPHPPLPPASEAAPAATAAAAARRLRPLQVAGQHPHRAAGRLPEPGGGGRAAGGHHLRTLGGAWRAGGVCLGHHRCVCVWGGGGLPGWAACLAPALQPRSASKRSAGR